MAMVEIITDIEPIRFSQLQASSKKELRKMPRLFVLCECGCGQEIPKWDDYGRLRRYVPGHKRNRTPSQVNAARESEKRNRPKTPWNKGLFYRLRGKKVYRNKCAWQRALKLLYGNLCAVCGWCEGSCDGHHLEAKSKGGLNTIDNGVVLCPNHHRIAEEGKISLELMVSARDAALRVVLEAGKGEV